MLNSARLALSAGVWRRGKRMIWTPSTFLASCCEDALTSLGEAFQSDAGHDRRSL